MSDAAERVAEFAQKFRLVLGHYPTGVCAVTAVDDDGIAVGLIVGSFTSVSLDPPLVGFFPDKSSSSWPRIREIGRFCVNVLSDRQQDVSRSLAAKGADKFGDIDFTLSSTGSPIIDGALAWIDCTLEAVSEAGDHYAVLGRVQDLAVEGQGNPMIFFKGKLGSIAP